MLLGSLQRTEDKPELLRSCTGALEGTQDPALPLLQAVAAWQAPGPLTSDEEGAGHVLLMFKGARS